MIRKFRAWWRRINEHYREKAELLVMADELLRQLEVPAQTFEEIELHCLRIAMMHLQLAAYGRSLLAQEALTAAGIGEARPTVH